MKIYILIYVYHGIIQEPEIFYHKKDVLKKYKEMKKRIRPEYDELEYYCLTTDKRGLNH